MSRGSMSIVQPADRMHGVPQESAPPHGHCHLVRRVGALVASIAVLTVGAAACSLPADERVTPYAADDLPPDLVNPTTTSTTTTTTTTPVTSESSPSVEPTITTAPTTTMAAVEVQSIKVFYRPSLASDGIRSAPLNLAPPVQISDVVRELAILRPEVRDLGMRTAVRTNLIDAVQLDRGVAQVELGGEVLDQMPTDQQLLAIAQIVLTLTSFTTPDDGNIGFVTFVKNGEPLEVFLPNFTTTDQPVAYADYSVMLEGQANTTTTTSTSTTTTTTTTATTVATTLPTSTDAIAGPSDTTSDGGTVVAVGP